MPKKVITIRATEQEEKQIKNLLAEIKDMLYGVEYSRIILEALKRYKPRGRF